MNDEMSIIHLFLAASPVVQAVMVLLLLASVFSWALIVQKWLELRRAGSEAQVFEKRFWSGIDLVDLYRQLAKRRDEAFGTAAVFLAGFGEFARLRKQGGVDPRAVVEGAERAMRVSVSRELDKLEHHLAFLATVGSTSPYIGLFGTVWGIMNSFRALGSAQHATLAMVAPGIAEALIATAMGLFAAIPAVMAYNRYVDRVERLANRYEAFREEFGTLLSRRAHVAAPAAEETV